MTEPERTDVPWGRSRPRVATVRLGARLARRELRRRPWRTALVLVMVLLPTATMAIVATLIRTAAWTEADHSAEVGQADAQASPIVDETPTNDGTTTREDEDRYSAATVERLRAELPAGSEILVEQRFDDRAGDDDRRSYFTVSNVPIDDPMAEGRFTDLRGRAPATPDEVVVTEAIADDLDLRIGDRMTPERLDRTLTVVGVVHPRGWPTDAAFVTGSLPSDTRWAPTVWIDLPDDALPDEPVVDPTTGMAEAPLQIAGWHLSGSESFDGGDDGGSAVFWTYVGGGVGLIVLGTVIAAAFAVGARRQLRTVGLLSASGASPTVVKWFLVTQGILTGLVGSLVGVGVGALVMHLLPLRVLDRMAGHAVTGPVTRLADVAPMVIIGTLAAAGAAWLPARTVSTVPTLQALAGRRPLSRVPRRLPAFGAASIGTGCALFAMAVAGNRGGGSSLWALIAVFGGLACLFGALAITPWMVAGLERLSGRLPESWRLAGRSLARNRVRTSAVIGAICAVAATTVAGGTLFNSLADDDQTCCGVNAPYQRDGQVVVEVFLPFAEGPGELGMAPPRKPSLAPPEEDAADPTTVVQDVADRLLSTVPDAELVSVPDLTTRQAGPSDVAVGAVQATFLPATGAETSNVADGLRVAIATPQLLRVLDVPDDLRAALEDGEAIGVVEPMFATTQVVLSADLASDVEKPDAGATVVPLGGTFASPAGSLGGLPQILLSAEVADDLGLVGRLSHRTVLVLPDAITEDQRRDLELLWDDIQWEQHTFAEVGASVPFVHLQIPDKPDVAQALVKAIILAISLLLVLAVVAIGLALAAKDTEDERQVLGAVGASPRILRRVGALRAVLMVVTAVVIAVPTGLLPAAAIVAAATAEPFDERVFRPDLWALAFVVLVLPLVIGAIALVGGRLRDAVRSTRPDVFAFTD